MAHGAGPGAGESLGRDVAMRQDIERGQELLTAVGLPPAAIGQGGEGAQNALVAGIGAVIGFDAPDGDKHVAVDAVARLDRLEVTVVALQFGAAVGDPRIAHPPGEIVPDGGVVLGLVVVAGDDVGVGLERLHHPDIEIARDAARLGLTLEIVDELAE